MFAGGPEITPDQFDWYFYQGRAIGFQVDLNCGSICTGKILLGSYMKKPLWVDHSATTVSTLVTLASCVTVVLPLSVLFYSRHLEIQSFIIKFFHCCVLQVFNLLTSSVRVIINGSESHFNPAQSFLVPCGKNISHILKLYSEFKSLISCQLTAQQQMSVSFFWDILVATLRMFRAHLWKWGLVYFLLMLLICSPRTCVQHPKRHRAACCCILHQDICRKFRLTMDASTVG